MAQAPVKMNDIQRRLIEEVADIHEVPFGAYNFRANGELAGRNKMYPIEWTEQAEGIASQRGGLMWG